jgi:adenylosuccinate lyase
MTPDYTSYLSPFAWRYGSAEMRSIWSEIHKRRLWRQPAADARRHLALRLAAPAPDAGEAVWEVTVGK